MKIVDHHCSGQTRREVCIVVRYCKPVLLGRCRRMFGIVVGDYIALLFRVSQKSDSHWGRRSSIINVWVGPDEW